MTAYGNEGKVAAAPQSYIRLWLLVLMALATFIRLHNASTFYYSPDEAMHSSIAAAPSLAGVLQFSRYEIHPPLLYILCHYWMMISSDPAFVRGLSLVFGIMAIPLYYRIGKLLGGELTGLACATLIAFSHGCIIQSYVVRQYMIFLFFLSLAFYFYLAWKQQRNISSLVAYGLSATLACMTHFSGIFSIFCIAAFECIGLLRRKAPRAGTSHWLIVNAVVGSLALIVYHLWQPILIPLQSFFATHVGGSLPSVVMHALIFPIAASGYILPGYAAGLIFIMCQIGVFILPPRNMAILRPVLALSGLAYALGVFLIVTRLYPEPGTRHSLWVLPFVIAPAGVMLGLALQWLMETLLPTSKLQLQIASLLLLMAGMVTYDEQARFNEGSEYVWQQEIWDSFNSYMSSLGPSDLIVTEKDDGIMLANLYYNMGDALTGNSMAALTPYRNTRILFNPYYPRNYSTDVFLATLHEAQEKHMLDRAQRLVFLRMAWSRSPLTDLMLCDSLQKTIVTFPPLPSLTKDNIVTRDVLERTRGALMSVDKQALLNDVLSPQGKARGCLAGKWDMVPGFMHAQH